MGAGGRAGAGGALSTAGLGAGLFVIRFSGGGEAVVQMRWHSGRGSLPSTSLERAVGVWEGTAAGAAEARGRVFNFSPILSRSPYCWRLRLASLVSRPESCSTVRDKAAIFLDPSVRLPSEASFLPNFSSRTHCSAALNCSRYSSIFRGMPLSVSFFISSHAFQTWSRLSSFKSYILPSRYGFVRLKCRPESVGIKVGRSLGVVQGCYYNFFQVKKITVFTRGGVY